MDEKNDDVLDDVEPKPKKGFIAGDPVVELYD
jgi:hypothetical protein